MKVILASASPRRKELLKRIFPNFDIIPAEIDESIPDDIGIEFAPTYLAAAKAEAIAENYPDDLIIAADTVVIFDGEVFGKPTDDQNAIKMLRALSGNTHKVITGCCIRKGDRCTSFSEESLVSFYNLSDSEIDQYVKSGASKGKAGAYGIQDRGALFVEKIEGDYYNIVGLPIGRINQEIKTILEEEK